MSPALDIASLANGASHSHTNGHSLKPKTKPAPGFSTLAIHTGSSPDPSTGAVIPAISLSTTYAQSAPGVHQGYEYSRSDNPNRRALEQLLSAIEKGGKESLAFASGSAATGVVVQALGGVRVVKDEVTGNERVERPHVLSVNDVYGGTYRYLKRVASDGQGLEVTLLDIENATEEDVRKAIRPNTKLIWLESPTNPTLKTLPIARIAKIAREPLPGSVDSFPLLLVDNTFASPFFQSPLLLGADLVLHSLTKYVNGHSDVVMGAVIVPDAANHPAPASVISPVSTSTSGASASGSANQAARVNQAKAFYEKLRFLQNATGAVPSAYDCWLAQRGAKTLAVRMKAHGVGGIRIAKLLETHPLVSRVIYPGLPSNAGYATAWANLSAHARRWILSEVLPLSSSSNTPFNGAATPTSSGDSGYTTPSPTASVDGLAQSLADGSPLSAQNESGEDVPPAPEGGFPSSGMVSFRLPTFDAAVLFLQKSRLFTLAESLGGVESLAEHPASMTHGGIPAAERAAIGIDDGLVRLSVGIEDVEDLERDVWEALEGVRVELGL